MCQYWKKLHTCTHLSDRPYIEMCRPGYLSNTVCRDVSETATPRPSHFPCYPCIKQAAHAEAQEKRAQVAVAALAASEARETAGKQRVEGEKKTREERARREASDKAERERVRELQVMVLREEEEAQRAKVEGGNWVLAEAGGGKKKRVKGALPASPVSPIGAAKKGIWKENERGAELSGRAGTWGPKKILSRKEGAAVLTSLGDGTKGANVVKKQQDGR